MQGSTTWALTMGRRERGAVAVEMAIILPLLLLVVGGIVDFGRLLFTQNIVTNAAREGARSAALGYTTATATARVDQAMVGVPMWHVTPSTGSFKPTVSQANSAVPLESPSSLIGSEGHASPSRTSHSSFPIPVTRSRPQRRVPDEVWWMRAAR